MGCFLAKQDNEAAWQALLELLPNKTNTAFDTQPPKYLEVPDFSTGVSISEYWDVSLQYCRDVLNHSKDNAYRMQDVVKNVNCFKAAGLIGEMATTLREACPSLNDIERYALWKDLISYKNRCEGYPDTDWAPTPEDFAAIKDLIVDIAPQGIYFEALRTCSEPDYELIVSDDFSGGHEEALAMRLASLRPLYEAEGWNSIERLIVDGAKGLLLGETLAHLLLCDDGTTTVLSYLDEERASQRFELARSFLWAKYKLNGWKWADSAVSADWTQKRIARFYAMLPFEKSCWEKAEGMLGDDSSLYWAELPDVWTVSDADDVEHCVRQLLGVNRAALAVEIVKHSVDGGIDVDPNIAMDAIEGITVSDIGSMSSFYIGELFKFLEKEKPCDRLCALEFQFAALIQDRSDAYLYKRMAENPDLFVDVVEMAYGEPGPEEGGQLSANISWTIRYRVLGNWTLSPGFGEDGVFDREVFERWISEARRKALASGVLDGADFQIGRNLFYAQVPIDGFFMPEAMAEFLDSCDAALNGYSIETVNSRGVHTLDHTGKQEENIALSYDAKAEAAEERGYVNFAATLRSAAKSYRQEAERNRDWE